MAARMTELGSLLLPLVLLALIGMAIILRAAGHARYISRTASSDYVPVPMRVLQARLAPLNVDGLAMATDRLTATTSMLVVSYGFCVGGKEYVAEAVFPMEIEWLQPRVSPLRLLDDLEAGRLGTCHVNKQRPGEAMLFTGWSPYLRSHVRGVSASGVLLVLLAVALYWLV